LKKLLKRQMFRGLCSRFRTGSRKFCTTPPPNGEAVSRTRTTTTTELWKMRNKLKKQFQIIHQDPPTGQYVSASQTKISLPFLSNKVLYSQYVRYDGGVRFGKLLEDMDAIAGNVAFMHTQGKTVNVTAIVDNIGVRRRVPMTVDLFMEGRVIHVGRSSMTIRVDLYGEDPDDSYVFAHFVFVGTKQGKSTEVNPLLVRTPKEEFDWNEGQKLNNIRKEQKKVSLKQNTPTLEEFSLVHHNYFGMENAINESLPRETIPMSKTVNEYSLIAQPQESNRGGAIFGGYLMRKALELSRVCFYSILADPINEGAILMAVDDVQFFTPVSVGCLLKLESKILFSDSESQKSCQIRVVARKRDLLKQEEEFQTATEICFTWGIREGILPRVFPTTYSESMEWLEGRRSFYFMKEDSRLVGSSLFHLF